MTKEIKTGRNSAIELLRILAMAMIVLCHVCTHSGVDSVYSVLSLNRLFVQFTKVGNMCVALYVMISGYFRSSFSTRGLSRLLGQVWTYSLGLFLVCRFVFGYSYSGEMLWKVFLPTVCDEYWFFTVYIMLILLAPFLNKMLDNLTRKQFETMLILMVLLWSVFPTLTNQDLYAAELPQFVMYYCLGAWFRMYPDNVFRKKGLRWAAALGPLVILAVLTVVLGYCERFTPEAFGAAKRFYNRNSVLILTATMGILSLAAFAKPFTNHFINIVGGCAFGVYLIHDNPAVRELLWKNWLYWGDYFTSGSYILRQLASAVLVYMVCTAIEWIRQKTVARPLDTAIESLLGRLLKKSSFV
jgi:surface polysaccharide O-acyltransferase-like enzyme